MTHSQEFRGGEDVTRPIRDKRTVGMRDAVTRVMPKAQTERERVTPAKKAAFYKEWRPPIDACCGTYSEYSSDEHKRLAIETLGERSNWGEKPVSESAILRALIEADRAIKKSRPN